MLSADNASPADESILWAVSLSLPMGTNELQILIADVANVVGIAAGAIGDLVFHIIK